MSEKAISAGGVVLNKHDQVLIVNQRGNSWSLPKGHLDKGEKILQAARREIYEESGVHRLRLISDLGSYERARIGKNGGGESKDEIKTLHFYLFRTDQLKLCPIDKDNPEARWVDLKKAATMLTHPRDRKFIRDMIHTIRRRSKS